MKRKNNFWDLYILIIFYRVQVIWSNIFYFILVLRHSYFKFQAFVSRTRLIIRIAISLMSKDEKKGHSRNGVADRVLSAIVSNSAQGRKIEWFSPAGSLLLYGGYRTTQISIQRNIKVLS